MANDKFAIVDEKLHFKTKRGLLSIPTELQVVFERTASDYFNAASMPPPSYGDLPFFAYGLFKPGQLGFDSLRPNVLTVDGEEGMDGVLYERDGVPLLVQRPEGSKNRVQGTLITFAPESVGEVYTSIASIEPECVYKWATLTTAKGIKANVLVATSLEGAEEVPGGNWDGRKDPLFNEALDMVESMSGESPFEMGSVNRLLELQMAYMLLWTAIERYASLRYHLRKKVEAKLRHMDKEPGFQAAIAKYVQEERAVFSTEAGKPIWLRRNDARAARKYYYQVRCNITHRGKALMVDSVMLLDSIKELTAIFRDTLTSAFEECSLDAQMSLEPSTSVT